MSESRGSPHFTMRMDEGTRIKLERIAEDRGLPLATTIKRLIDEEVQRKGGPVYIYTRIP